MTAAKLYEVGKPIAVIERRNRGLYFHFGLLLLGRIPPRLAKGFPATPCFIVSGRRATLMMTSMPLLVACWNATGIKEGWRSWDVWTTAVTALLEGTKCRLQKLGARRLEERVSQIQAWAL